MPTLSVEPPHFSAAVVAVTLDTVITPGWVGDDTSAPNTAGGATTSSPPAIIEMARQCLPRGRHDCLPRPTLRTRDERSAPIIRGNAFQEPDCDCAVDLGEACSRGPSTAPTVPANY